MKDSRLGVVEDTLYVSMLGRIYASENYKNIVTIQSKLENLTDFLAVASRQMNL